MHCASAQRLRTRLDDEKGCWGHFWMTAEQLRAQEKISDDARKEARDAYRQKAYSGRGLGEGPSTGRRASGWLPNLTTRRYLAYVARGTIQSCPTGLSCV